jgi:hypothetical protein
MCHAVAIRGLPKTEIARAPAIFGYLASAAQHFVSAVACTLSRQGAAFRTLRVPDLTRIADIKINK